jgi:hypothetical protein
MRKIKERSNGISNLTVKLWANEAKIEQEKQGDAVNDRQHLTSAKVKVKWGASFERIMFRTLFAWCLFEYAYYNVTKSGLIMPFRYRL